MDKVIKVSKEVHLSLKVGASNRGITMKEHLSNLADKNVNGIVFDVESHDIDTLIAVRDDINEELLQREK